MSIRRYFDQQLSDLRDRILTAAEAAEYGLVDEVLQKEKKKDKKKDKSNSSI